MRSARHVCLVVTLASVTVACAADPSTARPTTTAPAATSTTTTTIAVTTTTSAPASITTTTGSPPDDTTTTEPAPTTTEDPTFDAFGWETFDDDGGEAELGSLEVPLDHDDPDGETIELAVARHRALDPDRRIGVLLINPGGPGGPGTSLAYYADRAFEPEVLDRFDIVGWDPRGVGRSSPSIDCITERERYFSIELSPDTPEEEETLLDTAAAIATGCVRRSGDLIDHVSSVDSARDMDAIREALGEEQVSYLGLSYGSTLGATWATMFPDTVRAAVLDGALDPTLGFTEIGIAQAIGFERALTAFLADCSDRFACRLYNGGDAETAYAELATQVELDPPETEFGRPDIVDGVFQQVTAGLLYSNTSWPLLERILDGLRDGDGAQLLETLGAEESADSGMLDIADAALAIFCADAATGRPRDEVIAEAVAARPYFTAVSRLGLNVAFRTVICASFPQRTLEKVELTGAGAGPIMVVGTTGDPATPYEGSVAMADALEDGFLLTVEGDFHTAYGSNACATRVIDEYLVDMAAPSDLLCEG